MDKSKAIKNSYKKGDQSPGRTPEKKGLRMLWRTENILKEDGKGWEDE